MLARLYSSPSDQKIFKNISIFIYILKNIKKYFLFSLKINPIFVLPTSNSNSVSSYDALG
jgi:hypothetical protein